MVWAFITNRRTIPVQRAMGVSLFSVSTECEKEDVKERGERFRLDNKIEPGA